jgi:hypothetical protein
MDGSAPTPPTKFERPDRGRAVAGRDGFGGFTICGSTFVVVGRDEHELAVSPDTR